MILPDFQSASDDMATLRRFLPLIRSEAPMPADNARLVHLQNSIHQHLSFVMNARDGMAKGDGSQTRATAMATVDAAQNAAEELIVALEAVRMEVRRAFLARPTVPAVRVIPALPNRPSPDAGFSGFSSPAGA